MTLEIRFPIEFIVHGIPVSSQTSRAASKTAWKTLSRAASAAVLPEGHFCSTGRMAVTLYYFPGQPMQGDIDNIVKPILDALSHHVYLDDRQVERRPDRGVDLMSASHGRREAAVLEMLRPSFEDQGFEVFLHPPRQFLPAFMKGYQPDAIAIRPGRKIAIEVNADPTDTARQPQVPNISALFQGQKDWEFRFVYAPASSQPPDIAKEPKTIIEANLDRLPAIYDQSGPLPALLSAWSLFEAAARWLIPYELRRPQPPGALVDKLAFEGFVTLDEAAPLRSLARLHDEAAHGRLEIAFSRDDLLGMAEVIRTLLDQSAAPETSAAEGSA